MDRRCATLLHRGNGRQDGPAAGYDIVDNKNRISGDVGIIWKFDLDILVPSPDLAPDRMPRAEFVSQLSNPLDRLFVRAQHDRLLSMSLFRCEMCNGFGCKQIIDFNLRKNLAY